MTLIAVVVAADGVAMASDSAATFNEGVKYPTTKVRMGGGRFLWGAAGHEGLIQDISTRVAGALATTDPTQLAQLPILALRENLQKMVSPVQQQYAASHVRGLPPPHHEPATAQLLFVTYCEGRPVIIEVEPNGSVGQLEAYGFAAIGSGAPYAHAMFMRFRNKVLPLDLAEIIAYRAVEEAIEVASYGLAPPVRLWRMKVSEDTSVDVAEELGAELERVQYGLGLWRESEIQSLPSGFELPDRPTSTGVTNPAPGVTPLVESATAGDSTAGTTPS